MLKVLLHEDVATWDYLTGKWACKDVGVRSLLQAHYDIEVADTESPRDLFLKKGSEGKLWAALKALYGKRIKLIRLVPSPAPKILKGRDY